MADISENNYDDEKVQNKNEKKLSIFKAVQNNLCMYVVSDRFVQTLHISNLSYNSNFSSLKKVYRAN